MDAIQTAQEASSDVVVSQLKAADIKPSRKGRRKKEVDELANATISEDQVMNLTDLVKNAPN